MRKNPYPFLGRNPNRGSCPHVVDWADFDQLWGVAARRLQAEYYEILATAGGERADAFAMGAYDKITSLTIKLLKRKPQEPKAPSWVGEDWEVDAMRGDVIAINLKDARGSGSMVRAVAGNVSLGDRGVICSAPAMVALLVDIYDDPATPRGTKGKIKKVVGPLRPDLFRPYGTVGGEVVYERQKVDKRNDAPDVSHDKAASDTIWDTPAANRLVAAIMDPAVEGVYFWDAEDEGSGR
jgi:hypothetical protein